MRRSLLAVLKEEPEATVAGAQQGGKERLGEEVGGPLPGGLVDHRGAFPLLPKRGGCPGAFRDVMPSTFLPTLIDVFLYSSLGL